MQALRHWRSMFTTRARGEARMITRKVHTIVAVAALAGVAFSVFQWGPSLAQFTGGGSTTVEVSNTIQAEARITGQTDPLSVTGTVALDGASLETLNEPQCPPLSMAHAGVDGTVRAVPSSANASRTRLIVVNHANTGYISCRTGPSVGFTSPVCTSAAAGATQEGALVYPGASLTLDITNATILRCLNCTPAGAPSGSTVQASFIELSCI